MVSRSCGVWVGAGARSNNGPGAGYTVAVQALRARMLEAIAGCTPNSLASQRYTSSRSGSRVHPSPCGESPESLRGDDALQWAEQVAIDGDRATYESCTIAHDLFSEDGDREIMIASLRYLDTFATIDGSWYVAERKLLLDWSETRPSTPGT